MRARLLIVGSSMLVIAGCPSDPAPSDGSAESGSQETESSSGTSASSTGDSTGEELGEWPEESFGFYYFDRGIEPGSPGRYEGSLSNMELTEDLLSITHLGCDAMSSTQEFQLMVDSAEVHILPASGDTQVLWDGDAVASELIVRPGETCAEIEVELVEPVDPATPMWLFRRGGVFISDMCGPEDDVWGYDLAPEVPAGCNE